MKRDPHYPIITNMYRCLPNLDQGPLTAGIARAAAGALPLQIESSSAKRLSPKPNEERAVPRRVKDFIDISEYTSLDDLIRYLETVRDNLPPEHQAEMKIRGDEVFGRRLTITYFREQTSDEVELENKYAEDSSGAEMDDLKRKLDEVPFEPNKVKRG